MKPECRQGIAQQIDIMPTILSLVGYSRPYIAFGQDLTKTNAEDSWAVNYNNGIYQFIKGDFFLQSDGKSITGLYDYKRDPMLRNDLKDLDDQATKRQSDQMLRTLKAIIKDYMRRMEKNELIWR